MATSAIEQLNFLREVSVQSKGIMPLMTGHKTFEQTLRELAHKAQQTTATDKNKLLMEQVAWIKTVMPIFEEFFYERIKKRFEWNITPPIVTDNEFAAAAVADIINRNSFTNYSIIVEGAGTGL